jgi:3-oxoacyl-[acyl-carrier protein] reductase
MRFKDKTALVTGGSQGFGQAVCERLAAEGARVAVVASRSVEKAAAVAATLGNGAQGYAADVRDSAALRATVAQVHQDFGRIDVLVNSADVFLPTPAGATDEAIMDQMIGVNLRGTFVAIDAVVPIMKAQGGGAIVHFASVAGVAGIGTYGIYCATKAGIMLLTRSLAQELGPHGIRVNAIAPGNTETPMNEAIRTEAQFKPMLEAMAARTPSGRTYSPPAEMAGMAAFLASEEARSMHGSTVLMDEGISAGL